MNLKQKAYKSPWWLKNPHLGTVVPSLLRQVQMSYDRERMPTPDGDFMDLDWIKGDQKRLIILCHGLEGSSGRTYMKGAAKIFSENAWDVLSWNCRSCSGEMNLKPRFYHHGDSTDLNSVIEHVLTKNSYEQVFLAGFSMGGSIITKYLGEGNFNIPPNIIGGAAISTPFDLKGSAERLDGKGMGFYRRRFLKKLGLKIEAKATRWPDIFDVEGYKEINSFRQFDTNYTAPLHGFKDADDFYFQSGAGRYLSGIKRAFLIINAENDPFLTEDCYPTKQAKSNPNLVLEMPRFGGHVGFLQSKSEFTWSDERLLSFAQQIP